LSLSELREKHNDSRKEQIESFEEAVEGRVKGATKYIELIYLNAVISSGVNSFDSEKSARRHSLLEQEKSPDFFSTFKDLLRE
jgi:hypothetical protein